MDHNELRQKWPQLKDKIAKDRPELSEEDLRYEAGKEAELMLRLEEKLKMNRKEIDNWLSLLG